MNYIKLKLGGKERGAKLGIGYLKHLTEVYKLSLDDIFKKIQGSQSILIIPEFIFYSLSLNDKKANNKIDYTIDDIIEWLDEAGGIKSDAWVLFQESLLESVGVDPIIIDSEGKNKPQEIAAE